MKALGLAELATIAVALVVISFTISIGSTILSDLGEETCDYTWISNTTIPTGANISGNPAAEDKWLGCCVTVDTGNNCTEWHHSASLNVSFRGSESMQELGSWMPTLSLVMIAAIIIGVLVTYLSGGSSRV